MHKGAAKGGQRQHTYFFETNALYGKSSNSTIFAHSVLIADGL
jgi:hypothetical protein